MVKLIGKVEIEKIENGKVYGRAKLYADNKSEMTGIKPVNIVGLNASSVLTAGSTVVTSKGDAGILDSTNVWNWL